MECWRRGFRPKGILHAVLPNMGTVYSDASCVCHLLCKLHVPMFELAGLSGLNATTPNQPSRRNSQGGQFVSPSSGRFE